MDDLISRQEAIDAVSNMLRRKFGIGGELAGITLAELPSAQPDSKELSFTHKSLDTISRQAVIDALTHKWDGMVTSVFDVVKSLPSAHPEIIRCKDCKHWKDSDGVYRRGIGAESKCPLNLKKVYEGTFYCGMAERRTDG